MALSTPLPNPFVTCKYTPMLTEPLRMPRYRYGPLQRTSQA
jgi:hypothetical protein